MASTQEQHLEELSKGYRFGWHDPDHSVFVPKKGLSEAVVEEISAMKSEPDWMRKFRLKSLKHFRNRPMPWWGADLSDINFDDIYYFIRSTEKQAKNWEDLPEDIKGTWDKLGIPEAEKKFLGGVSAQYESEVVYHKIKKELDDIGVLFTDMDTALREHPDIVKEYFGTIIPPNDNKFAALNSAVWSGGSFIYVPPGVHVDIPLQAYFRINAENMGQFERTLIIADEGSYVHYVEGCLLKGERVELSGGRSLPIEQVALGDEVIDSKGRPTRVTGVMELDYDGPVYRFGSETSGNSFVATREHPLLVVRRRDVVVKRKARNGWLPEVSSSKLRTAKPDWVEAQDVEVGDFLVYPKVQPAPEVPLHPAFMRLAGWYLAEGSAQLINGCKALTFSLHADETAYAEEIRDLCEELWGARGSVTVHKDRRALTVTVYTKGGYDAMREHVGSRSWSKQLSPLLFSQDEAGLRSLVEAYVNGDGNQIQRGASTPWVRCHTTSYEWAMQLQSIMVRLGVLATVRLSRKGGPAVIQDRDVMRHDLWVVQWTADKVHSEIRETDKHFLVPIKHIEVEEYMGPVYNIETESQEYSVRGFATHNCSAPIYTTDSLHSAVVELIAKPGARIRYTTIQNWSTNVYNLVTKRAAAYEDAIVEWVDGNIGSKVTMKYPSIYLLGKGARGEVLSVAYAGPGMHTDAGGKAIHVAPHTTSVINSKSVSKGGGRTGYRGLIRVEPEAHHAKSTVRCDALILDEESRSDTYPYIEVEDETASLAHEATVSKVGDDQLFYLMSRGLTEVEATAMIVNGFIEPITRELPMEYAVELNRLIELQMEGSVG